MNKFNVLGVSLCSVVFLASFFISGGIGSYWSLAAFLVVFSGLFAATFLCYPFEKISKSFKLVRRVYTNKESNPATLVNTLLNIAVQSRISGPFSLEKAAHETKDEFLKSGIHLLVDNCDEREIRDCLTADMNFFSLRRRQSERIFHTMARLAPAFGVAGSVIGLIGLLMGINDTAIILKSIPVAFISTLYGVILSNMVFAPMAECINYATTQEMLNKKLILEAVVAISREENPYVIERKLSSFLSPEQREGQMEELKSITKRHLEKVRSSTKQAAKEQKRSARQTRPARTTQPAAARTTSPVARQPKSREIDLASEVLSENPPQLINDDVELGKAI
ncbi:MAG: motility protein A [Desulfovibrio sp.]